MQIVRTIVWILILFGILAFSLFNWETVEVALWENFVLETKIPALVIVAFLLGLVPTWLYHRSVKWSLQRRIRSLENSIKSSALSAQHASASENDTGSVDEAVDKPVDEPVKAGDNSSPGDPPREAANAPSPLGPAPGDVSAPGDRPA